jgi:DNA-binding CsgD family transcriptional regulator
MKGVTSEGAAGSAATGNVGASWHDGCVTEPTPFEALHKDGSIRARGHMLDELGLKGFAERARRELQATGSVVRPRKEPTKTALTSQEEQIARLAGAGLTNPEIGARLFLSPHTVDWHLRKVFSKLGIGSRREILGLLATSAGLRTQDVR